MGASHLSPLKSQSKRKPVCIEMELLKVFLFDPLYLFVFCALLIVFYYVLRVYKVNGVPCRSKQRLDGKTVIITGGNTGIGREVALDLAQRGGRVIIACRDLIKGEAAQKEIIESSGNKNVILKKLDLASMKSIRDFASDVLAEEPHIDILICNAGVMFTPYKLTEDGFELQFGVNHLGHFYLTHLLLDRIKESTPSRIVVVASIAHYTGYLDFNDMMWTKRYNPQLSYCRSKLANVMYARELAKRIKGSGVTVCSLHPGTVYTEITRYFFSGWLSVLKVRIVFSIYVQ